MISNSPRHRDRTANSLDSHPDKTAIHHSKVRGNKVSRDNKASKGRVNRARVNKDNKRKMVRDSKGNNPVKASSPDNNRGNKDRASRVKVSKGN